MAPLSFTLASLLAPPKKLLALRVTADWAMMLRGAATRSVREVG